MGKKLYVGNLPYTADDQFLMDTFAECGKVESARVIMDRESGRSKGFAFVEMSNDDEAQRVIDEFNGATCNGRPLRISEARPQEARAPRSGGMRPPMGRGNGIERRNSPRE